MEIIQLQPAIPAPPPGPWITFQFCLASCNGRCAAWTGPEKSICLTTCWEVCYVGPPAQGCATWCAEQYPHAWQIAERATCVDGCSAGGTLPYPPPTPTMSCLIGCSSSLSRDIAQCQRGYPANDYLSCTSTAYSQYLSCVGSCFRTPGQPVPALRPGGTIPNVQ